ncbi:MAG TPA: UV DNA damage repair endonuclease UvsE [Gemmatales bacterium]|nr:UV DNA damage repair endonuclease UvsE [Gemmatales bacterium]
MIRLGLCCVFRNEPIRFHTTTAAAIGRMERKAALEKINGLCLVNAESLHAALEYCVNNAIGCFRVLSQILPLKTHPQHRYEMADLPQGKEIVQLFRRCGQFVRKHKLRTCLHPDQFVVLNSPRAEVVETSIAELEYHGELAEWIHADVINIHGGGAYGNKAKALDDFARNFSKLSKRVTKRLTLENDDKIYTPSDLLPLCQSLKIPLVYDVHHHRCHPDDTTEEHATHKAMTTWDREPMFHISSPLEGWKGPKPLRHHDYIDPADFPSFWVPLALTVEVEAKAKELAVLRMKEYLKQDKLLALS